MSGIEILPDELIDIVEEYVEEIVLRKIDNISEIINLHSKIYIVVYSQNIIVIYIRHEKKYYIYYKRKLSLTLCELRIDCILILDDETIAWSGQTFNLEHKVMEFNKTEFKYCNKNENTINYFKDNWSRGHGGIRAIISAKGNIWDEHDKNITYNGRIICKNAEHNELMCSINDEFLILRNYKNGVITVVNKNNYELGGRFYRFYGSEYAVRTDGNVYKLELLDLKKFSFTEN